MRVVKEYWMVRTARCAWPVSRVMAQHVEREAARRWRRRWLTFVDITGARIRIRTDAVMVVEQSAPEHRAEWRAWCDQLDAENEASEEGGGS
jgi:hypothetical protein